MQKNRKFTEIITLLVFLAITVFINLIFAKLNLTVDLTEDKMYRVSDSARSITETLEREMDVYCFVNDENKANAFCEITRNFCETSDKLHYKTVDPVEHPDVAKRYTKDGAELTNNTVVFDNGTNYRIVPYSEMFSYNYLTGQKNLLVAEEKFCLAIMSLSRETEPKIAFLSGHGESLDESLEERVEDIGTICEDVDLRNGEISGFDAVMLISPKLDFTAQDIEKLEKFLADGGTLIVSVDADMPYHETLEGFLAEWGITVNRNIVFSTDSKSIMGNQPYSVIGRLKSHPITDGLIKNNISPVFFASRSITPVWEVHGGVRVTVLAETSENAAAVSLDTGQGEEKGVFSLLTLSQGEKGRIFTFGSNMFFSEDLNVFNRDLLRNIITWSTDGELINEVSPKIITGSSIKVPKESISFWNFVFGVVFPAIIILAGIIVAIRRRKH